MSDPRKALTPATVPIVGYPDEVAMVLRTQHRMNRLASDPRTLTYDRRDDGRVLAQATILLPRRAAGRRRVDDTFQQIGKALAFVSALMLAAAALVATVLLVDAIRTVVLSALAIAAVVAVIAWLITRPSGDCPGVTTHCPPKHHR